MHQDILREKDRSTQCCLIVDGWAYRYKILEEGRRQILSFHIPGDLPDHQSLHLRVMDHGIATLTPCTVVIIPHEALLDFALRFRLAKKTSYSAARSATAGSMRMSSNSAGPSILLRSHIDATPVRAYPRAAIQPGVRQGTDHALGLAHDLLAGTLVAAPVLVRGTND